MGKQPETQERFQVHCEAASEEAMGVLVAQLTRMDVKILGIELVTDVLAYKRKAVRREISVAAVDAITEWVKEHPTFKVADAIDHFNGAEGCSRNTIYTVVTGMVEAGTLKRLGSGNYSAASVKHIIEGPKKPKKHSARKKRYETSNRSLLLTTFRNRKQFTTSEATELFLKNGRPRNSVFPICDRLINERVIKRAGPKGSGVYVVVAKAAKPKKKKPVTVFGGKTAKVLNGAAPASGGAAHG